MTASPTNPDVERAASWLVEHFDTAPRPLLPTLRRRFGIGNVVAIAALRRANVIRDSGGA